MYMCICMRAYACALATGHYARAPSSDMYIRILCMYMHIPCICICTCMCPPQVERALRAAHPSCTARNPTQVSEQVSKQLSK